MDWWKENWWIVAVVAIVGTLALSLAFVVVVMGVQVILHGVTDCSR